MEKVLLIVDDNKDIIEIVTEVLSGLFDRTIGASTIEEAQNLLSENVFAFVILDINLEGRNGAEVIKFLSDAPENPNKGVPFAIVSGILTPQFIEKNTQRFAGIFMKPFDHNELKSIVEKYVLDKPESPKIDDIPYLKCDLPFPIVQLEKRVSVVLDGIKKNPKLKDLFSRMKVDRSGDNYLLTHIGMLINISTGISIQLEWNTDKTLEKFVYVAYLHDMALVDKPELARIASFADLEKVKGTLSEYDYKLVLEHPNIADRSIEDMKEIPPDVAMIIKQHHELPNADGFPAKISFQKIPPLSAVFIIAQNLTEHILLNPNWNMGEYIKLARPKFKGAHFNKIFSSLGEMK